MFIDAPHNMPSVSSDDAGLEDRDEDFFEVSEKESEKFSGLVPEVRNVCSVPKVASGSNLASVRVFFSFDFFSLPESILSCKLCCKYIRFWL